MRRRQKQSATLRSWKFRHTARSRFLALILGTVLLLPLLIPMLSTASLAQFALPGAGASGQAPANALIPRQQWWDPGRAYPCGRFWCSHVVLPFFPLPPPEKQVVVAVATTASLPESEARAAAELRSLAILESISSLVSRLRKPQASEDPTTATDLATSSRSWFFWQKKPSHPRTPALEVGIENEQTVIYVVGNPARAIAQQTIATVTETDATQAGIGIPELAGRWRDRFRRAISDALWGIDFDRRHPFGRELLVLGFVTASVPLIVVLLRLGRIVDGIQRRVRRRQERQERRTRQAAMDALGVHSEKPDLLRPASLQKPEVLRQAASLLHLLKRLIQIAIVATALCVVVLALAVFPASRDLATYLTGQSLVLPLLWLALIVLQPLLALTVDQGLARWGRSMALLDPESNRHELRITTYSKVLHTAVSFFCLLLGLYGTVLLIGIDPGILAGAGLLAVAIGFLTRNLLEDILNGALILFTDRFAIGDVITVGDKGGLVEDMNLHITSLRGTDGQLTSIPNRRIDVVDNLTQRWSRVDFTVRVAAAADPRQALAVVEAEAQRFWQEPEWQELLMAPPDLLGIDEISHAGTLIRVWIATRPLKQWLVGRQFRLRIKLALEEAGIELGMPQQRVFLPEASPGALEPSP